MTGYVDLAAFHDGAPEQCCDVSAARMSDGSYLVAVRTTRLVDDIPPHRIDILMKPTKTQADWDEYFKSDRCRRAAIEASPRARIDHARAGSKVFFGNLHDVRKELVDLKASGLRVPDRVFAFIDDQHDLLGYGGVQ